MSLASSVLKYPVENGRRYHAYKAGQYPFPCDEKELDRMDMTHHMCKLGIGALHLSPIGPNPQRIGDIGTGSGIWAIEMGRSMHAGTGINSDLHASPGCS